MDTYTVVVWRHRTVEEHQKNWLQTQSAELARERNQNEYNYVEAVLPVNKMDTIYEQTIENYLDLEAVIRAVNRMEPKTKP